MTGLSVQASTTTKEGVAVPPALLSDQDKETIKTVLIEALLQESDKSIRDLLAETLHTAAVHEYPDRWPNLLPLLLTTIQSSSSSSLTTHLSVDQQPKNIQILNILWVHNALLAIRKIVKRYEYKSKEQRGPLDDIVKQGFPLLLPLGQRFILPEEHSLEAATCLRQILKIFWSATQFYWPSNIDSQHVDPWFEILKNVMAKPLPEAYTGLE